MSSDFHYSGPLPAFAATSGPKDAKIALVAEAWGQQEELTRQPLIGTAGQELNRMLLEAGINRAECFATNVFAFRPTDNKIEILCGQKKDVGKKYILAPLSTGKYVYPKYLGELLRLYEELEIVQPNLIIALGNTAMWALSQQTKIGSMRGTTFTTAIEETRKKISAIAVYDARAKEYWGEFARS